MYNFDCYFQLDSAITILVSQFHRKNQPVVSRTLPVISLFGSFNYAGWVGMITFPTLAKNITFRDWSMSWCKRYTVSGCWLLLAHESRGWYSISQKNTNAFEHNKCFTSALVFGYWLMNHVIFLKLGQKWLLLQAEQNNFFHSKWSGLKVIILSETSCHLLTCLAFNKILSDLEINQMIYEPPTNN